MQRRKKVLTSLSLTMICCITKKSKTIKSANSIQGFSEEILMQFDLEQIRKGNRKQKLKNISKNI